MNKITYRCPQVASHKVEKRVARNVQRLGLILKVVGHRYAASIRSATSTFTTTFEVVTVYGVNGTARFPACWGYGGSGPHVVRRILMECGMSSDAAEAIAFTSPRNDCGG
jgi:hypothetical protein